MSLVLEATREKGIPVGTYGEVTEYLETVPDPAEREACLPVASPSITGIEKLVGEL